MKNKHKSINKILVEINGYLKEHKIDIIDFWDGDRCAIGFSKNHRLIYICTYNLQNQIYFEIEEHPAVLTDTKYEVLSNGYLLNLNELTSLMDNYLI
jgi:hypothetical protein